MMKLLSIIICLLLAFSCNKPKKEVDSSIYKSANGEITNTTKSVSEEYVTESCIYKHPNINLDTVELYRKSKDIVVNSFIQPINRFSPSPNATDEEILIEKIKFEKTNLYESIHLNKTQKDSLFYLLNGFEDNSVIAVAECYFPRHSIDFYDKNKKQIGRIEFCFECLQARANISEFIYKSNGQLFYYENFLKWCGITKSFRR